MTRYFFWFFCLCATATAQTRPRLVVLSIGGFRRAYFDTSTMAGNLENLTKEKAAPTHLKPVFPTKTSVNLFSIATGLYAQQHGVISNCEYDEPKDACRYGVYDHLTETTFPIWIENEHRGGISGVMNWSGSKPRYHNKFPTHYQDNSESTQEDYHDLADTIIRWLKDTKKPANLVLAHFDMLDKLLHQHAAQSTRVLNELMPISGLITHFLNELKSNDLLTTTNVIVLGSQGSQTVSVSGRIKLDEILTGENECPFTAMGATAIVTPTTNVQLDTVYETLKEYANSADDNVTKYSVYKVDEIPPEWHLKDLAVLQGKIYLVANVEYGFWNGYFEGIMNEQINSGYITSEEYFEASFDGYSNQADITNTFFVGIGPSFKVKKRVAAFQTIDIYPLLRELLGFQGDINVLQRQTTLNEEVRKMLVDPSEPSEPSEPKKQLARKKPTEPLEPKDELESEKLLNAANYKDDFKV